MFGLGNNNEDFISDTDRENLNLRRALFNIHDDWQDEEERLPWPLSARDTDLFYACQTCSYPIMRAIRRLTLMRDGNGSIIGVVASADILVRKIIS